MPAAVRLARPRTLLIAALGVAVLALIVALVGADTASAGLRDVAKNVDKTGSSSAKSFARLAVIVIAVIALVTRSPKVILTSLFVVLIAGSMIYSPDTLMKAGSDIVTNFFG